ncbi:sugar phosphate nucleotidyltransferase [soil metagenome]
MLGILPAAGAATRFQPLAFSKEVLPVGSRTDAEGAEHPVAASEFAVERMVIAGADRICFVISPDKSDIVRYYAKHQHADRFFYVVQDRPRGMCDALFRAAGHARDDEDVLIALPDTIWFPLDGLARRPAGALAFLLFPVESPDRFDAVATDEAGNVREIEVKSATPSTAWIWGGIRMPARTLRALDRLWREPGRGDESVGTLVNEHLRRGGVALAVRAGEKYFDIGTAEGYREAVAQLAHVPADHAA